MSLIRELGPVMAALMVIARVGSATCAEIGIMRNEQQFDALDCMAIDSYPLCYFTETFSWTYFSTTAYCHV